MPQPFIVSNEELVFATAALQGRQRLAALLGELVVAWASLEAALASNFTWLLNGQERHAFDLYHELRDGNLRYMAFRTVALVRLPPEMIEEFDDLWRQVRRRAGERNDVAHGLWAATADLPDSLLLVDQKEMNASTAAKLRLSHDTTWDEMLEIVASAREVEVVSSYRGMRLQEYKDRDFKAVTARITELTNRVSLYGVRVLFHSGRASL